MAGARITLDTDAEGQRRLRLSGDWKLMTLAPHYGRLAAELAAHAGDAGLAWDVSRIGTLDSVGAMMLWHAWGHRLPAQLASRPELAAVFERISGHQKKHEAGPEPGSPLEWIIIVAAWRWTSGARRPT